jgi:DNA-directed RNA polymerase subunit RPC12/RpoP
LYIFGVAVIPYNSSEGMNYKNYDNNDNNRSLEEEFAKAVKMLEQAQKTAKDKELMDTELREINADLRLKALNLKEEIVSLKDENVALKEKIKKLEGGTQQFDLSERGNLFFATGLNTPVCYNCSMEKMRPVVLTVETGSVYKCNTCEARYLYDPRSTEPKEEINIYG